MIGSLYSGISGLKVNTSAMAVIGDNIANVDTTGYKSTKVAFANIFSSTLNRTGLEIGRGVSLSGVTASWDSGATESTTSNTDLAINGTGMFVVSEPATNTTYYTRAGQFDWDKDGNLVTLDGLLVQGYSIDTNGTVGPLDDITMPVASGAPRATDEIGFGLNLDSRAATTEPFETSITVYDSLGAEVYVDFTFTPDGAGGYTTAATAYHSTDPTTALTCTVTNGALAFDTNGNLTGVTANPNISIAAIPGGATTPLAFDWIVAEDDGTGTYISNGSITRYAETSVKSAQSQTGYPAGSLQSVSVDENGYFTGFYSNGTMIPFAQVALADFASYAGLNKMGSNLYAESLASGQALISAPNTASLGGISSNTLERSNVDMASEFVELITTQRAYQANSKVITTSDEVLQELINIKTIVF